MPAGLILCSCGCCELRSPVVLLCPEYCFVPFFRSSAPHSQTTLFGHDPWVLVGERDKDVSLGSVFDNDSLEEFWGYNLKSLSSTRKQLADGVCRDGKLGSRKELALWRGGTDWKEPSQLATGKPLPLNYISNSVWKLKKNLKTSVSNELDI